MFSEMCVSIKLNWFVIFLLTDGFRLPMFGKAMPLKHVFLLHLIMFCFRQQFLSVRKCIDKLVS